MKLERFRTRHEHPFWEEWAWAQYGAQEIINNNSLVDALELVTINEHDRVLLRLDIMDRIFRERMLELQGRKRRVTVPNSVRRVFNIAPVNIDLFHDASNHLIAIRENYIDQNFQGTRLTQKAHDIELAVNDLFRRFQQEHHMVLGPGEYIDNRLLNSWGDTWRPRIKGGY